MPHCETVQPSTGGGRGVAMNLPRKSRGPCYYCGKPGTNLCDFKTGPILTCDRPMCSGCSTPGPGETDLCREHAGELPLIPREI